jgi:hypothetical protein
MTPGQEITTQSVPETTTVYVPGGTDPSVPPVPLIPDHNIVLQDDGETFIEFDDDGTPLGQWTWDPDNGWEYEEFEDTDPPRSELPYTDGIDIGLLTLILSTLCLAGGFLIRRR